MPLLPSPDYKPPFFLFEGHLQTIIPSVFRKVKVPYLRERISTPDHDFLDLDWCYSNPENKSKKLAILSHGLEGDSSRQYITGMVKTLNQISFDTLSWNMRGCSGEINKQLRFYHSGATDDLQTVIDHALSKDTYEEIILIGFSLGGNITLKYAGERHKIISKFIKKVLVFSVPCDLMESSKKMAQRQNHIYMSRFLHHLRKKIKLKSALYPDKINDIGFHKIKNFKDFDDRYTAPLHGFKDAVDYWAKCSSVYFLKDIAIPTLIVNAANDPFLSPRCYPVEIARSSENVFLEIPNEGGHCGFSYKKNTYWSEKRATEWILNSK